MSKFVENPAKGYVLSLVSVMALSNVYLFSKAALREVSFYQFGIYWFGLGIFWTMIYVKMTGNFHRFTGMSRKGLYLLLLLGVMDMASTYFFFKAIHTVANPSIVSFVGNISPALVITLSVILLGERLGLKGLLGVIFALSGAFVISYRGRESLEGVFLHGTEYVLYGSMISSVSAVITKNYIRDELPPVVLVINRLVFLWLLSFVALWITGQSWSIPVSALENIAIGSVLGPFLTAITGYLALQYIPLSHKAVIGSLKGVFVLLGAYLWFDVFPENKELIGGMIGILGVLLISTERLRKG